MYNRDLANCDRNASNEIITKGAEVKIADLKMDVIPECFFTEHEQCRIHMHDLEFYDVTYNCLGVSVQGLIGDQVTDFRDACSRLIREIIALTNAQSGGIGFIDFDGDMAEYVGCESDDEIRRSLSEMLKMLNTDLRKGCEKAYVTFNFGLDTTEPGRRVTYLLLEAFRNGDEGQSYIFPNLVFKLRRGVNLQMNDPNYDLFRLAAHTTAQCMIPTYFNTDATYNATFDPASLGVMGCRTRLATNRSGDGGALFRGNLAANTINLIQLALECRKNREDFFTLLDNAMETAYDMLRHRFDTLAKHGNFAYVREKRIMLNPTEDIDTMARNNTLAIGFIGLYECIRVLYGDLDINSVREQGIEIIRHMREITDAYTDKGEHNVSLLATSAEGISGKFPRHDRAFHGDIEGITDKEYYTNSFHAPVNIALSCFEKIIWEAPFHALCNGGCITYVELSESPVGNDDAIVELVTFAHDSDMNYFGINFPLDVCRCGAKGIFKEVCPVCGGTEIKRLRRVSGYLSEVSKFTRGKKAELKARVASAL